MKNEQLSVALTMEVINYLNTNELNNDLRRLFLEVIILTSQRKEYDTLPDNLRIYCEAKAYEDLCRLSVHYNPEKTGNALPYMTTIARSSFACMIVKHGKTQIESRR